jgi:hypothetical protein
MNVMNKTLITATCLLFLAVGKSFGAPITNSLLTITAPWYYTTNNVDAAGWAEPNYDASGWAGPSNALLYIETAATPAPKSTPLPPKPGGGPMPCYYFRTTFQLTNAATAIMLMVTNVIDDGAVFYLNGVEVQRLRVDAGPVSYTTVANNTPIGGDASAYEVLTITGGPLTNLVTGTNVLAVRVHQQGTTSSDVVFGTALGVVSDPNPQPKLTRGPYLQVSTPTSIVIRWRTDFPEGSLVVWGTNLASMVYTNHNPEPITEHQVLLTNLAVDTVYSYAIGNSNQFRAGFDTNCFFRTHPLPGTPKPLHIWVIGDAGTRTASQVAVRNAFENLNGTNFVDAWLQLGDNAYPNGTDVEHQGAVFNMYTNLLRKSVTWATLGNHETYSTDPNGLYAHLNIWTFPTNGAAGGVPSGSKLYYSFDIGMVHFICLDSMSTSRATNGAMATWLRADLASTTNRWLIAFWHQPPYSRGSHNSDTEQELVEMRVNFLPILEAGGVDLVLGGHSHSYERSFLLDGHYGVSSTFMQAMKLNAGGGRLTNGIGGYIKPENYVGTPIGRRGAVYVVAGSSGQTSGGTLNHPAMFTSLNLLGSMVLDITTNRLDAIFLRENGQTNDSFTMIKTNFPPTASNLTFNVAADISTGLTLSATDVNRNPVTFFNTNSPPTNGLLSGLDTAAGTVTYRPARGTLSDQFTFVASDGQLTSTPGAVTVQVTPPADTNQNGLADSWETTYGISNPNGDNDSDGVINLHEYRAGTNPTNALSWLRITQINKGVSGFQMVWSAVGGTRYRVQYSDGDAQGGFNGQFTPLPRSVAVEMDQDPVGVPGTMSFTDDFTLTGEAPVNGNRFFRIALVP